ncbi:hypothetical protein [Kitasatospora sp. NPDC085879]|uniref:hypothetical protein n=1 Tax=Kitasatospora sp. NPDC085879 TaxID=3154769 RepID=UPI0034293365
MAAAHGSVNSEPERPVAAVEVVVRGKVPPAAVDHARAVVEAAARHARAPVLSVQVELVQSRGRKAELSAVARVILDVAGRTARVRVAAETVADAVDLLRSRLVYRLDRLGRRTSWPHPLPPGP